MERYDEAFLVDFNRVSSPPLPMHGLLDDVVGLQRPRSLPRSPG